MSTSQTRGHKWDPASEARPAPHRDQPGVRLALATLLMAAGAALFFMQVFDWAPSGALWPVWILGAGALMVLLAFAGARAIGELLVLLGGIALSVGAILLVQSLTGYWLSWAYAWTLVAPTAIGGAMWLWGRVNQRNDMLSLGATMVRVGAILFAVLFAFYELVLGLGGRGLTRTAWGIALIVFGALWMGFSLWQRGHQR